MSPEQKLTIFREIVESLESPLPAYNTLKARTEIKFDLTLGFIRLQGEMFESVEHDAPAKRYRSEKEEFTNLDNLRKITTTVIDGDEGWIQEGDSTVTPLDETQIAEKLLRPFMSFATDDSSNPLTGMLKTDQLNGVDWDADSTRHQLDSAFTYTGMQEFEGHTCYAFRLLSPAEGDYASGQQGTFDFFIDKQETVLRGAEVFLDGNALSSGEDASNPFAQVGNMRITATITYHEGKLSKLPALVKVVATSESNTLAGSLEINIQEVVLDSKLDSKRFSEPKARR